MMRLWPLWAFIAYVWIGMLTGAYYFQHRVDHHRTLPEVDAAIVGAIWPLYWQYRLAAWVTA